jgi:hypothetical protein
MAFGMDHTLGGVTTFLDTDATDDDDDKYDDVVLNRGEKVGRNVVGTNDSKDIAMGSGLVLRPVGPVVVEKEGIVLCAVVVFMVGVSMKKA